jgi:hypothetical protein
LNGCFTAMNSAARMFQSSRLLPVNPLRTGHFA